MAIKYYGAPNETALAQYARDRRTREEKVPYGPSASFFWPGLMRLDGEGGDAGIIPISGWLCGICTAGLWDTGISSGHGRAEVCAVG
jgi:hypothetical protein